MNESPTRDVNQPSIYKVPDWLKDGVSDTMTYTPEIISFGPYHWRTPRVIEMENHKLRCFEKMLTRTNKQNDDFINSIKEILPKVRFCYPKGIFSKDEERETRKGKGKGKEKDVDKYKEKVRLCYETISEDDFVKMLVLDGCFMLEYLRVLRLGLKALEYGLDDPVFSKKTIMEVIERDMIKLENQIPIIVLKKLLEIQYNGRPGGLDLPFFVLHALNPIWVSNEVLTEQQSDQTMKTVAASIKDRMLHCLDIFRYYLLFGRNAAGATTSASNAAGTTTSASNAAGATTSASNAAGAITSARNANIGTLPLYDMSRTNSVEDLRTSGVRFKIGNSRPFWDIQFNNRQRCLLLPRGELEIPPIQINKTSKTMFLNLIAYEQCHFQAFQEMEITDYVAFMDTLINTGSDVRHLHQKGIIVHQLGSDDEVADLFNSLVRKAYVASKDGRLNDIYKRLNDFCSRHRNAWYADLRHNYLKSPWVMISIIAAFFLFLLTLLQTAYTMQAYYNPPK